MREGDEEEGTGREGGGSLVDIDVGSSLLLLGEFHSVAEDLDSLLLMTGSTCLGKLTVEAEHLPAPERTQQTTTVHKAAGLQAAPDKCRSVGAADSLRIGLTEGSPVSQVNQAPDYHELGDYSIFRLEGSGEEILRKAWVGCGKVRQDRFWLFFSVLQ